jgi:hypothetical protein
LEAENSFQVVPAAHSHAGRAEGGQWRWEAEKVNVNESLRGTVVEKLDMLASGLEKEEEEETLNSLPQHSVGTVF